MKDRCIRPSGQMQPFQWYQQPSFKRHDTGCQRKATAFEHAQAVLSVLRDALSEGEFEDIRAELPAEIYDDFFAGK